MDDEAPGVPEWVVTYGDMMSLLLTFFIMLVSLSEVKNDEKYRAVLESIQQYTGYQSAPLTPPGKNFPLNSFFKKLETLGSFTDDDNASGGVRTEAPVGSDLRVFRTQEGVPIQIGEYVQFAAGDAELTGKAKTSLIAIAATLAGKPNKIEIRAHTSGEPIPDDSPFDNKVSLTYERARNVLIYLESQGISHERLRVSAAADIEPLASSGDDRTSRLDRVEVLTFDTTAQDFVGPRETLE